MLRDLIAHCHETSLDVAHELKRGAPYNFHPVQEILHASAYDALLILEPFLKEKRYGGVFVNRSETGFYIGEGTFEGSGPNALFKACGRGVLLCDGQRTEGAWRNNLPNGMARHYPKDGPLRCYEGEVRDGKLQGKGQLAFTDGRLLRCTWVNEMRHGQGEMTWPNGDRLIAIWKEGTMLPGGTFVAQDSRCFEGAIDAQTCKPHGACVITWQGGPQIGARYEGRVDHGTPTGRGLYTFGAQEMLQGFQYAGPFFKGDKHGDGELVELSTDKAHPCYFNHDTLEGPPPERTDLDFKDEI